VLDLGEKRVRKEEDRERLQSVAIQREAGGDDRDRRGKGNQPGRAPISETRDGKNSRPAVQNLARPGEMNGGTGKKGKWARKNTKPTTRRLKTGRIRAVQGVRVKGGALANFQVVFNRKGLIS